MNKNAYIRALRAARKIKTQGQTPRRVSSWFRAIKEALRG